MLVRVVIALEHHFARSADGSVWSQTQYHYSFWQRYLHIFSEVVVVARLKDVNDLPADAERCDGMGVSFVRLPDYRGPWEYIRSLAEAKRSVTGIVERDDAVILRVPGAVSERVRSSLGRRERPYAVEVVGDPHEVFAPDAVQHPLRRAFRWWFTRQLQRQTVNACAAAYVSDRILPNRFPCEGYVTSYSSIELIDSAFVDVPPAASADSRPHRISFVGSLAQRYKGVDVLIDALYECKRQGMNVNLTLIGDGKYRHQLETQVARLALSDSVMFVGQAPAGDAVRAFLDESDLFVLPSRTEGLPRAMIEAMARGIPCIGSHVGGIPELLPVEDMVPAGNAHALATKIREVVSDQERMDAMAARNLAKAQEYRDDILQARRVDFYRYVRERTEEWIISRGL